MTLSKFYRSRRFDDSLLNMNIFQRLLLRNFLLNLARSIAVLGVVIAGMAFPDISANWPGAAATSLSVMSYVAVQLLVVLDKILPRALLIATLFTVGPLARYQELTALSSAGWSLLRIMRPLVLVALVGVVYAAGVRVFGVVTAADPVYGSSALAERTAFFADQAYPLVPLLFVLTGIILAASPRRASIYGNFIVALAVLFVFNVVLSVALACGRHGLLPPVVAGWGGHVLFAVVLTILWGRAKR